MPTKNLFLLRCVACISDSKKFIFSRYAIVRGPAAYDNISLSRKNRSLAGQRRKRIRQYYLLPLVRSQHASEPFDRERVWHTNGRVSIKKLPYAACQGEYARLCYYYNYFARGRFSRCKTIARKKENKPNTRGKRSNRNDKRNATAYRPKKSTKGVNNRAYGSQVSCYISRHFIGRPWKPKRAFLRYLLSPNARFERFRRY